MTLAFGCLPVTRQVRYARITVAWRKRSPFVANEFVRFGEVSSTGCTLETLATRLIRRQHSSHCSLRLGVDVPVALRRGSSQVRVFVEGVGEPRDRRCREVALVNALVSEQRHVIAGSNGSYRSQDPRLAGDGRDPGRPSCSGLARRAAARSIGRVGRTRTHPVHGELRRKGCRMCRALTRTASRLTQHSEFSPFVANAFGRFGEVPSCLLCASLPAPTFDSCDASGGWGLGGGMDPEATGSPRAPSLPSLAGGRHHP